MDRALQCRILKRSDQAQHDSGRLPGGTGALSQGGDTGSNPVGAANSD
jgi:hypothetical protein